MKILIVSNNVFMRGNGVSSAVLSLKSRLLEEGMDVRILSCENPDRNGSQPEYPLKHFKFPIVEPIIETNGYRFPKTDKKMIREAVIWADVIHLMEGFPLQAATMEIACELGKPCVGSYHVFTENITANLGLPDNTFINRWVNRWWRNSVYNHCKCIHCPTETVKKHLTENGYTAPLEVISNGIALPEEQILPPESFEAPYRILCIGRLSNEKSQMTLIDAMRHCRHAADIELHFAGNGPKAGKIKRAAYQLVIDRVLKHKPVFGFYDSAQLKSLASSSYLYVHCARIEVEGLSCLEAIRQGTVPVIADAPLSATSQFALDERSLFPVSDSVALAEKIDWWIEHPEERMRMGKKYAKSAMEYDINDSIRKTIRMYKEVLNDEIV